jgi:hypothetical protein
MKKEKLLNEIENNLDTFRNHFGKIKKEDFKIHPIDIDLLKKKTIAIYDALAAFETKLEKNKDKSGKPFQMPEVTPKGEISEKVVGSGIEEIIKTADRKPEQYKEPNEETESQETTEKRGTEKDFIPSATITNESKNKEEKIVEEKPVENKQESTKQIFQKPDVPLPEKEDEPKSTVDLFSDSASESIGERIGPKDQSSVADKMQKSQVNDLRQAIGINEKFLFINELFNGDLGRYNKVIDELNELKTQEGINAYLIELKVANQWSDKNDAYLKLKSLLDRKIN